MVFTGWFVGLSVWVLCSLGGYMVRFFWSLTFWLKSVLKYGPLGVLQGI